MGPRITRAARRRPAQADRCVRIEIEGMARLFDWRGETCTIGSAVESELVVEDDYVSKRHCQLRWNERSELWLTDLDSRNGTFVNGHRVARCQVAAGACIAIGRTRLRLLPPQLGAHGIVGTHPRLQAMLQRIERLGPTAQSVLVLGETGTGKELVARALHEASAQRGGAFEPLNCAAIPAALAESQLFGHVRGAFTGADQARDGAFVRAHGGTLFLDEIGEMPLELQPKLLRVLEDRRVRPVGGSELRSVQVRVIAATHRDLRKEARTGRFRLDLYHRLAVAQIELPALRERATDIPALARHFLAAMGSGARLSPAAEQALLRHSWPGNVRALRHAIERASVLGGEVLEPHDFDLEPDGSARASAAETSAFVRVRGRNMGEIRRAVYLRALAETGNNRSRAAALLGVPKSTFFDHLKALGLDAEAIERETAALAETLGEL
ncbi:MAG: sigma 54-interacting transcriptional regulator [Myxococcales bacterium]|nr:sigma 54-interacting transcriptional regulator [Myxococcales bacterium]